MQDQLQQTCRKLLAEGRVQVVIGYGQASEGGAVYPVFVTRPEDAGQLVWNDRCFANLTTYLTRPEIRELGKPAIVVKGCDERALAMLVAESQIVRDDVVVIGMACEGQGRPPLDKCGLCEFHMPRSADVTIGEVANGAVPAAARYAALERLMERSPQERMAYWRKEFERCVKCYACRQTCPLCYCPQCIAEKNRPQVIDTSASMKGNFGWHITRAFHLAGRCVGCGECSRVCPAGIDLQLLNLSMARAAEEQFDYRAGLDPEARPLIGSFAASDQESFIR